jgi:hypothetical protein
VNGVVVSQRLLAYLLDNFASGEAGVRNPFRALLTATRKSAKASADHRFRQTRPPFEPWRA